MASTSVSDQRREQVMRVALELIAEKGYAAASTRELCERMGFTKAALYYWFPTKADLLAAVTAPLLTDVGELVDTTPIDPAPAARRAFVKRYADLVEKHPHQIGVLGSDRSTRAEPCLQEWTDRFVLLEQRVTGQREPTVADRVRVRSAIGGLHAALTRREPDEDLRESHDVALAVAYDALGIAPRARRG